MINNYKDYNGYNGYKSSPIFGQLTIIFDFTTEFCQIYIDIGYKNYKGYKGYSRQSDQLIQAGRSSKQCWAEGALEKSIESKLKMWGVTRASLEELLQDYLDFLRQRELPLWDKDDPRAAAKGYLKNPEEAANCMIYLINQTNQLIDQKYRWEEEKFVKDFVTLPVSSSPSGFSLTPKRKPRFSNGNLTTPGYSKLTRTPALS